MVGYYKPEEIETDIDIATRWWGDYPLNNYTRLARPVDLHNEFITEAFRKPKKLARSVSASRYEGFKDVPFDFPLHRSPSVSKLSPSHMLPPSDRNAVHYIDMYKAYEPRSYTPYYHQTLAPWKARELLAEVSRPSRRPSSTITPIKKVSYLPEMQHKIESTFYNHLYRPASYMDVAAAHLTNRVGTQLRSVGYKLPLIYTSYDQHYYNPFDRHVRSGGVIHSRTRKPMMISHTMYRSIAPRYAYKPYIGIMASNRF